jgi:hypothetical protein
MPLQILKNGQLTSCAPGGITNAMDYHFMILATTVGEIETRDVHTGPGHGLQNRQ